MPIILNHSVKEVCKFTLTALAEIEYDKDKSYQLSLHIVDSRTKNPLSYRNICLEEGKGAIEEDFDYSSCIEDGISIKVTALVTELPSPEPEPDSSPEAGTALGNVPSRTIDTVSEDFRLFGLNDCLDNLDFCQEFSYCQRTAFPQLQLLKAHASISLKNGYQLISLVDGSVELTYISSNSTQLTPGWDIHTAGNLITLQAQNPDRSLSPGFSGFRFSSAALVLHQPSGLVLMLPFVLDNR
ncbi:MAG TPA: hypothetical protein DCZ40_01605 [Lachnospiraceae bacterium]|nr:hypothetical protein [Lachnospiraceae bacterium]